jgi:outer membrane protein assembly factor BamB
MRTTRWLASLWVLSVGVVSTVAGPHWPSWRGPTGMGTTDEANLPISWGGKDQTNVLWKAPLYEQADIARRDQNQSSPIVWGERVFVTLSYWPAGVSDTEYPEHHVICFGAKDGKRLWGTKIAPGPWKLTDLRGGYTAPTPACDGQRVYAVFGSAVIAALDLEGKPVWRKEITPHAFDVAIGASPIVHKDTVLMTCDLLKEKKGSRLLAYEAKTGALKYERARAVDWAHSTPAIVHIKGKPHLLMGSANGPQGLDPDTGEAIWWYKAGERVGDTVTPVHAGGLVYCDSGRGGPGVAVDATGAGDVTKTHLKWTINAVPEGFSSPVVIGDHMYRLHNPGVLTCRDFKTGAEVFKERLQGVETAASPFATPDGRIYCASSGKSYVLKAGSRAEILAVNDLGDPSRASPAVAAGRIYLKGGRYLFCIGGR